MVPIYTGNGFTFPDLSLKKHFLIFANSDKVKSVAIGLYGMINSMRYTGDYAGMFAAVVIVFLPTFLLYMFLSEKIIAGVTGGGVKG